MLVSKCDDKTDIVAARNTDGSIAVVVLNRGDRDTGYVLRWDGNLARIHFPAHSISTVII